MILNFRAMGSGLISIKIDEERKRLMIASRATKLQFFPLETVFTSRDHHIMIQKINKKLDECKDIEEVKKYVIDELRTEGLEWISAP